MNFSKRFFPALSVAAAAGVVLLTAACGGAAPENKPGGSGVSDVNQAGRPAIIPMPLPESLSEPRTAAITHIVLHFSSNVARNPRQPFIVGDILQTFREYGVSAHYLIARDGKIYRLVPDGRVAYHAGKGRLAGYPEYTDKLNQYSIGIELLAIGTREEMSSMIDGNVYQSLPEELIGYTTEQYGALNQLLDALLARYPALEKDRNSIIGHDEYASGRKTDPGLLFDWPRIRLHR